LYHIDSERIEFQIKWDSTLLHISDKHEFKKVILNKHGKVQIVVQES